MQVTLVEPPNRRNAELMYYFGFHRLPFELQVIVDESANEEIEVPSGFCVVRTRFRRHPVLGSRVGPGAVVRIQHLDRLLEGSDIVVSVETFSSLSAQVSEVAARMEIPHVIVAWETLDRNAVFRFPPYRDFLDIVRQRSTRVVCATNRARDCHLRLGFSADVCEVIYPGMDPPTSDIDHPGENSGDLLLLYVGKIVEWKGIRDMVRLSTLLVRQRVPHQLRIAGSGPLSGYLERMSKRRPQIAYLGRVSERRKFAEISDCSLFLYPSRFRRTFFVDRWEEQFGHSVVEAMMMGKPLVVSDSGALPEIVGDLAQVFPQGDLEGLQALTCSSASASVMKLRGGANRSRALKCFSLQKQSERFCDRLSGLTVHRGQRP